MKKNLLVTLILSLVLISSTALAENIDKGTVELSGNADISYLYDKTKYDIDSTETKTNGFGFSLNPQYYVIENLAVGAVASYGWFNVKFPSTRTISTSLNIGPLVGYNIHVADKFSIKPYAYIAYRMVKSRNELEAGGTKNTTYTGYQWALGVDGKYFIVDPVSINLGVLYLSKYEKNKDNSADKINTSEIAAQIGMSVYFNR
jgi:hypothetical protein